MKIIENPPLWNSQAFQSEDGRDGERQRLRSFGTGYHDSSSATRTTWSWERQEEKLADCRLTTMEVSGKEAMIGLEATMARLRWWQKVSVDRRAWTGALMVERSQIERGHWTSELTSSRVCSDQWQWSLDVARKDANSPAVGATGWYKLQRR